MTTHKKPTPPPSSHLTPCVTLDRSRVLAGASTTVSALVEVTAPPAPPVDRPSLDVVLVIDRSGSMGGQPLESVKSAVIDLLRLGASGDRFAVVTFESSVEQVLGLDRHDFATAAAAVATIVPAGSTNLSGGWAKGLEILVNHGRADALKRIVVLTDGHANCGVTDHHSLRALLNGGVSHGITTSFVGFADGYDEALLATLADAGRGNDYWAAGPDEARGVFVREFSDLGTVVAQNITVTVDIPNSTVRLLGDFAHQNIDGRLEVQVGDIYGDETRRVLVQFDVEADDISGVDSQPLPEGAVRVGWLSVGADAALHDVIVPVNLVAVADVAALGEADDKVAEEVLRATASEERRLATEAIRLGDEGAATHLLRLSISKHERMGLFDDADELRFTLDTLSSEGTAGVSARQLKEMHFRSRAASKGRVKRIPRDEK